MTAVLLVIVVFIPLAIAPGGLLHYDVTPKAILVLLGGAFALMMYREWLASFRNERGRWFVRLLTAQAISLVLSTALSVDVRLSIAGSNWRRFGLITQVAALLLGAAAAGLAANNITRQKWLARLLCLACLAGSAYGISQYFGFDPFQDAAGYQVGEGEWMIVRPPSTMGHAGYAATFFLYGIFAAGWRLRHERGIWRVIGWASIAAGSVAIVFSGTRAAMVGLAVGAALGVFLTGVRIRRLAVAAVALALFGALFYVSPAGERLRARVRWSTEDPRGGARLRLWRDSMKMGSGRWWSGWGPEVFPVAFPRFESRELARDFPDFYHESAHNVFVEAYVSQGAAGLLVLVALCGLGFARIRSNPVLSAGMAATLVAQMFTPFVLATATLFYLWVGLIVANEKPTEIQAGKKWPIAVASVLAAIFVVTAVQLLGAGYLQQKVSKELMAGNDQAAHILYERSRRMQAWGTTSDLWYSRMLLGRLPAAPNVLQGAATLERALDAAQRAAGQAEERQNALYHLGMLDAIRNDFPALETDLRRTIDVAPNWFKPHWMLAKALEVAGRKEEALAEAELAVDLDGGKHAEVAETWASLKKKK